MSDRRSAVFKLTQASTPLRVANQGGSASSTIPDTIAISSDAQKSYNSSQEATLSGLSVVAPKEGDAAGLQLIKTEEEQAKESSGLSSQINSVTLTQAGPVVPAGWNIEYSSTTVHYETEQMLVSVGGTVTTGDGRVIAFTLDLGLSREYSSIDQEEVKTGAVKVDPLVINFKGGLPGLSDTKFAFDINSDGSDELVYAIASGSGQ